MLDEVALDAVVEAFPQSVMMLFLCLKSLNNVLCENLAMTASQALEMLSVQENKCISCMHLCSDFLKSISKLRR